MALHLRPKTLTLIPIRSLSSSSNDNPFFSSPFADIKQTLRSPSPPPNPNPPSNPNPNPNPSSSSLSDINKVLSEFRLNSPNPNPNSNPLPPNPNPNRDRKLSFDSIRESLNQFRNAPRDPNPNAKAKSFQSAFNLKAFQESLLTPTPARDRSGAGGQLPYSIFGREMREEVMGGNEGGKKTVSTEFVRTYSYEELGEKLRKLRPAVEGKEWFSLEELNGRLAKLREIEEKETQNLTGGISFKDLRESLVRLKEADTNKKLNSMFLSSLL